jgi:hypothetical protein
VTKVTGVLLGETQLLGLFDGEGSGGDAVGALSVDIVNAISVAHFHAREVGSALFFWELNDGIVQMAGPGDAIGAGGKSVGIIKGKR